MSPARPALVRGVGASALWMLVAASTSSAQPATVASPAPLATFEAAWQIVSDTHFDPTFNGVDWAAVRDELRPRAATARSAAELRALIQDMLGRLGQSHFTLLPGEAVDDPGAGRTAEGDGDIGLEVRLLGDTVAVTAVHPGGPSAEAGVRAGWLLSAVDGHSVASLLDRLPGDLAPRLRQVEAWRGVTSHLRGPAGSLARLVFIDGGGVSRPVVLRRRPEPGEAVTIGSLPTFHVRVARERLDTAGGATAGLIRFNVWMTPVDGPLAAAVDEFRQSDGIVLDLRGNPGGLAAMLMGVSGHFIDEPRVLGTMKTRDAELRFVVNPRRVGATGARVTPYGGPVAILVDALTGSASECFAGGLQALGRARVFGQPSMGQALPALFDRLPNGDVLVHAYGDFVTASGERLEGRGVRPDELVPLDRQDLLDERDRPLEAALAWIDRVRR